MLAHRPQPKAHNPRFTSHSRHSTIPYLLASYLRTNASIPCAARAARLHPMETALLGLVIRQLHRTSNAAACCYRPATSLLPACYQPATGLLPSPNTLLTCCVLPPRPLRPLVPAFPLLSMTHIRSSAPAWPASAAAWWNQTRCRDARHC
jgi:hypothetical protein